jgi:GNAT superfamily N-acetyltransferase
MTAFVAPARPDDVDALVASAAALFAEDGGVRDPNMDVGWPLRDGAPFYRSLIGNDRAVALLAFPNPQRAQVIGHLTGTVAEPNAVRSGVRMATLQSLRVDAAHRRSGVAAALVAAFDRWALEHGADEIVVTAYASNANALAFYRRNGFADFEITLRRNPSPANPR